jgi:hypothetical protein
VHEGTAMKPELGHPTQNDRIATRTPRGHGRGDSAKRCAPAGPRCASRLLGRGGPDGTSANTALQRGEQIRHVLRGACRTQTSSQQRSRIRVSSGSNLEQTPAPTRQARVASTAGVRSLVVQDRRLRLPPIRFRYRTHCRGWAAGGVVSRA